MWYELERLERAEGRLLETWTSGAPGGGGGGGRAEYDEGCWAAGIGGGGGGVGCWYSGKACGCDI